MQRRNNMDSTFVTKVIHGLEVELDLDMNNDGADSSERVTGCFITKGGFGGSLDFLDLHGELINHDTGEVLEISPHTIEVIRKWAEKNGY
jgi:hypothetical protein